MQLIIIICLYFGFRGNKLQNKSEWQKRENIALIRKKGCLDWLSLSPKTYLMPFLNTDNPFRLLSL